MRTARIDSGQTYQQSGPTFGSNGNRCLELRVPPLTLVENRMYRSQYEQRNISQINFSASIVTNVRSPFWSMGRSAGSTNGVNEVVARRSQTTVQGRFSLQGLDLIMGFAIYSVAFYGSDTPDLQ